MKKAQPIWQRRALKLGALLPLESLEKSSVAAIRSLPVKERITVACSGGADSVALLLVLWTHFPERRGRWLVLHFNHKLRGRSSDGDARFVSGVAGNLGEKCVVGIWKRGSGATAKVSEADARAARHGFFELEMRKARSATIVFGHQREDVTETMIMRLSRGSGAGGLTAPRPVQSVAGGSMRLRPLLTIPRPVLREALQQAGASWREDASNETDDYFRNRVRRYVLPPLAKASPQDIHAGFAASRAQLEDDHAALEYLVTERVGQPEPGRPFNLSPLRLLPRSLIRRAIHRWLVAEDLVGVLSKAAVTDLIDAIHRGDDLRFSAGIRGFVRTKNSRLWMEHGPRTFHDEPNWREVRLRPGETIVGPAGDRVKAKRIRLTESLRKRIVAGEWSPTKIVHIDPGTGWTGVFVVRSWRSGDRYQPLGGPGRSTLQNLFVNRKIPKEQRKCLPVICNKDLSPLWVPGLPPAEEVALQPTSKLVVQLTYTPATAKLNRLNPETL